MDRTLPKLTTPRLVLQRDDLLFYRRVRVLTAQEYSDEVRKLQREQQRINKRSEKMKEEREAKRKAKEAQILAEKKEKRLAKLRATLAEKTLKLTTVVFNEIYDGSGEDFMWRSYKQTNGQGKLRTLIYKPDGRIRIDTSFNTDLKYKYYRRQFLDNESELIKMIAKLGDRVLMLQPTRIRAERLTQAYRDGGVDHCFFKPILQTLEKSIMTSPSKETVRKCTEAKNRVETFAKQYDTGIPEDAIEAVASSCGFRIIIEDILGNVIRTYNAKKHNKITFVNTRPNHVEVGKVVLRGDTTYITETEIISMWRSLQKSGEFYMIRGDIKAGIPSGITTLSGVYQINNPEHDMFMEMDEKARIKDWKLDALKHPDVNEFIKAGRIINSWVLEVNDKEATGHLDMPVAYTQFKNCKWYSGFLGKIHQWRSGKFDRDFIANHIGYYRFRIIKCDDVYLRAVGLKPSMFGNEWYILPSQEILYYMDCGMVIETNAGVWGSRMDFEFSEEMLKNRRYCIWAGRLGREKKHDSYSFSASSDWASHLKYQFGDENVFFWEHDGIVSVKVPRSECKTAHHILGGITAYLRIQVIEAMRKFNLENICKVVLDGIHFTGTPEGITIQDGFAQIDGINWKVKELKEHKWKLDSWFEPVSVSVNWSPLKFSRDTFLMGQGGSGKTHSIMTDSGFCDVLFIGPNNILGQMVWEKYGIRYTTIHKLIGASIDKKSCRPYRDEYRLPSVIFIDELTQISGAWIEKARAMHPECLFFFAGDMDREGRWYQCKFQGTLWKPVNCDIVEYTEDRRSLDENLKALKLEVRSMMRSVFESERSDIEMRLWAKERLPYVSLSEAIAMKQEGDLFLSGMNATNDKLLDLGVVSGWYRKGGYVAWVETKDYVKRGSFTYHSIQGTTIESAKVFIILDDMFDYSMLYTGISRVRTMDQLVFVRL